MQKGLAKSPTLESEAYLFMMAGTIQCFVRPRGGSWHAKRLRQLAPNSGLIVTPIQLHSSQADSPVRVRYAQPASLVSGRHPGGTPDIVARLIPSWEGLTLWRPSCRAPRPRRREPDY